LKIFAVQKVPLAKSTHPVEPDPEFLFEQVPDVYALATAIRFKIEKARSLIDPEWRIDCARRLGVISPISDTPYSSGSHLSSYNQRLFDEGMTF
jgi:hypothetical protein